MKLCPCCGKIEVDVFETCPECGWCNDYAQEDYPDLSDMPNNKMSLNEARAAYRENQRKVA